MGTTKVVNLAKDTDLTKFCHMLRFDGQPKGMGTIKVANLAKVTDLMKFHHTLRFERMT